MSSCLSTKINQDEEIWINMLSDKNQKHRDKFVAKMSNDNESQDSYEIFTKLITPGSQIIPGEFKTY